ncbi:MAG: hypothetical protein P9X22_00820, partial [Candidatus Zapsychrus exili]|nr:hypothetical protein [Candidatus Zapsychrus exili]
KLNEEIDSLKQEISILKSSDSNKEKEIKHLKKSETNLNKIINLLTSDKENLDSTIASLKQKMVDDAADLNNRLGGRIKILENQVITINNERDEIEKNLNNRIKGLLNDNNEKKSSVEYLKKEQEGLLHEIEGLRKENESLKK